MQRHLTDVQKQILRQTVHNADQLIADLEREAATPEGVNIEGFMTGLYLVSMNAPLPPQPDEPTESDDSEKDE